MIKKLFLFILCVCLVGCTPIEQENDPVQTTGFSQQDQEIIHAFIYDENYFFPFLLQQKYIYTKYKEDSISINFYNNAKFDALFNMDGTFNYNFSFQPNEIKIDGHLAATLLTSYSYTPNYFESNLLAYITINDKSSYYLFDQSKVELLDFVTKEIVAIDETVQPYIFELLKDQWNQMMRFRVLCENFGTFISKPITTDGLALLNEEQPIPGFINEWEY